MGRHHHAIRARAILQAWPTLPATVRPAWFEDRLAVISVRCGIEPDGSPLAAI
jgi:hypothetical protein